MIDEIGKGAGLTYQDDEPINYGKIQARDEHRWELNPASTEETDEDTLDQEDNGIWMCSGDWTARLRRSPLEVLDMDDLAQDEEETENIAEYGLDDIDELEDNDQEGDGED